MIKARERAALHQLLLTLWLWLAVVASVVLLALGSATLSEAERVGIGIDPLTSAEIEAVIRSVQADSRTLDASELLLVERHRETKAAQHANGRRRADVYLYEYSNDTLSTVVVDVESGLVESISTTSAVQLPLTTQEIERAVALVEQDVTVRQAIAAELKWIAGEPLTSIDAINIKAFTFLASAMPQRVNAAAAPCGEQRCAQLLLYTSDNVALDLMPIVNLSTGDVVQVMGLVAEAPHQHIGGGAHDH